MSPKTVQDYPKLLHCVNTVGRSMNLDLDAETLATILSLLIRQFTEARSLSKLLAAERWLGKLNLSILDSILVNSPKLEAHTIRTIYAQQRGPSIALDMPSSVEYVLFRIYRILTRASNKYT